MSTVNLKGFWAGAVGIICVMCSASCSQESNPLPAVPAITHEPAPSAIFVTVEPLGDVFTHEPTTNPDLVSEEPAG